MRISESGQITIPKELRDRYGFHSNVAVWLLPTENGLLIQKASEVGHPVDRVAGILDGSDSTLTNILRKSGADDNRTGYQRLA